MCKLARFYSTSILDLEKLSVEQIETMRRCMDAISADELNREYRIQEWNRVKKNYQTKEIEANRKIFESLNLDGAVKVKKLTAFELNKLISKDKKKNGSK